MDIKSTSKGHFSPPDYELYDDIALFKLNSGTTSNSKIICFPYAGGNGTVFDSLVPYLPSASLCAVEAPGHIYTSGMPISNITTLCDAYLQNLPYALWQGEVILLGHSLGAYIACQLASLLVSRKVKPKLILSAAPPPHCRNLIYKLSTLSLPELVKVLVAFGGLPGSWLEQSDLLQLYHDTLYADFKMYEEFIFPNNISHLDTLIIAGYNDALCPPSLFFEWSQYFSNYNIDFICGDHLFIAEKPKQVAHIIAQFTHVALSNNK